MSTHTRATIVVVTFNHRDIIGPCLEALRATLSPNDEVIIVDNASGDGTADFVAGHYSFARVIRSEANLGFGAACNRGAAEAMGEYVAFLNPDTEPRHGWLDALLEALTEVPAAGLATAKVLLARTPERVDAFGNEVHISGLTTSRGWGEPANEHERLEEVSAISGACFAVRRDVFDHLGGFDDRYFLYFEDTDLSLRARLAGYTCVAVPGAQVLHDHRPGFSPAKLRYLERNRWWTMLKLYEPRTLAALTPVLLAAELLAWGMALSSGPAHVRAKAQAWAELISWLPDLPRARSLARQSRGVSDRHLMRLHGSHLRFSQVAAGAAGRAAEAVAHAVFGGGRTLAAALSAR